ncbi:MAG: NHL repeat-containing protein [Actinomycetota bacterium]
MKLEEQIRARLTDAAANAPIESELPSLMTKRVRLARMRSVGASLVAASALTLASIAGIHYARSATPVAPVVPTRIAGIDIPKDSYDVLTDFGSVWVSGKSEILRIDPVTLKIQDRIKAPGIRNRKSSLYGGPRLYAVSWGVLVVDNGLIAPVNNGPTAGCCPVPTGVMYVINPASDSISLFSRGHSDGVVTDGSHVWSLDGYDLVAVAGTNGERSKIDHIEGIGAHDLIWGEGSIFVSYVPCVGSGCMSKVRRIDIRSQAHVVRDIDVGSSSNDSMRRGTRLIAFDGEIWLVNGQSLVRLDSNDVTGSDLRRVRIPGGAVGGVAASNRAVWLSSGRNSLVKIDEDTMRVALRITVPVDWLHGYFTTGLGSVWVVDGPLGKLYRITIG